MESIRIRNLRCLADSTAVGIKPISLLVGANSSGKSTFLRVFPLLKQSHQIRTLGGLVLNEGDVNFGYFSEALLKDAEPEELKLEFGFVMQPELMQGHPWNGFLHEATQVSCELTYVKGSKDARYPRIRAARIVLLHEENSEENIDTIEVSAGDDGKILEFKVNDFVAEDEVSSLRLRMGRGVVPSIATAVSEESSESLIDPYGVGTGAFDKRLLSITRSLFHGRTSRDTKLSMFIELKVGTPQQMLSAMQAAGAASWKESVRHWTVASKTFREVRNLLLARRAKDLFDSVNTYVTRLARSVHYFEPVRASVEREYANRDVSTVNVDSSGLNVALVLAAMQPLALNNFRQWMRKHVGFEVFPQSVQDGTRTALRMKETASGTEFNLADTGFGYSQMLPFLVQIWKIVDQKERSPRRVFIRHGEVAQIYKGENFIVAIEQPELHLHPALQSKLADLIVVMARLSHEQNVPIRFMLETHSPTIVERIGQSIEQSRLKAEDVQVLLFERTPGPSGTNVATVRSTSFDEQGVLQDWPFGFLSAPISEPAS